jgi:asparagine synthase (glutamine-hydrolysing)
MCGLFGSVGVEPDKKRIDLVAHRGPDGSGWQEFASPAGPVALGHRRLSIIDLSEGGAQPMADPTGTLHLTFNGEIYNYVELREELKEKGELFQTASDSDVLLRAYSVWGLDCLPKLRGMFSFLIWDERQRRLVAARDRFGIKPLYYFATPRGVAFASEIKQLLGLPGERRRMNIARIHDFLASGVSDHLADTMFEGVNQVRAAECAVVDCSGAAPVLTIRRWYPINAETIAIGEDAAGERFRALLSDSVRLHLRADVPIGSCLSGGLDSSAIVCLMSGMLGSQNGGAKVNTVSACYPEKEVDEKPFMDAVVADAKTEPHFIFPRAEDVFARASDITWHQDEPFGSTSIFAQWCVFEEARRVGVKVMLDGQGADEQLAGYHSGFHYYLSGLVRQGRISQLLRTIWERNRLHGTSIADQLRTFVVPLLPPRVRSLLRRQRQTMIQHDWLGADLIRENGNPLGPLAVGSQSLGLAEPHDVASLCLTLTHSSNLQMLLHWEDRNSMAHSIEARVPFLDHPLVEFSLALGGDHKIVGGDTKRVLRRAMTGVLPESVRQRRDKLGFATPEQRWFRGPLRGMIVEGTEATLKRYPELFSAAGVRALRDDMLEGRRTLDFTLWRIANLSLWGDRFAVTV